METRDSVSALLDLDPLLRPRSIAIIGATPDQRRVGGRPLVFLRRYGFPGQIYPVNPRYEAIDDLACYPNVDALPEVPDMAIIALPAARVVPVIRDCVAAGIPAATIYTSGFGEIGDEGAALESELRQAAESGNMVICGPNCQGVANFHDRVVSNWSSALGRQDMEPGPIGFVAQSGLFSGILAAECIERRLGLGYLVSSGNEVVLDFADFLGHMAQDPRIKVVAGYLEGVRDGTKLKAAAELARAHDTPVVVLKVGRSEESAKAARSHTGSMTGTYEVYRAAFKQWGIIEVDDIEELMDVIEAFALGAPPARGNRVGVLTNSGGIGVFCADKVRECGLRLADFAPETVAAIAETLPEFGSSQNPVDFTLQSFTHPELVGGHLRNIVQDAGVDAVLNFYGVQWLNVAEVTSEVVKADALNDKPIAVAWAQGDPDGPSRLRQAGVPTYDDPLRAIKVIRALANQGRIMTREPEEATRPDPAAATAAAMLRECAGEGALGEHAAGEVLEAAGIPVVRSALAPDAAAAVEIAEQIGYPVVLKIAATEIAHKTEAGGVALGLGSAEAVTGAFEAVTASARAHAPEARIDGTIVQEMVTGTFELIVGVKREPAFGPVLLLGTGGTFVEVLKDTVLRVLPIGRAEAEAMVRELGSYPMLSGARGQAKADIAAIVDVLLEVAALALAAEEIQELDINPLMVRPEGKGVVAADALITLGTETF